MVAPEQVIEEFDPIVEVMSDKATVEITSPFAGRITSLAGKVGDMIKVGGRLCDVDVNDEFAEPQHGGTTRGVDSRTGNVLVSTTPAPSIVFPDVSTPNSVVAIVSNHDIHATPATRRLAKESSISLRDVVGTGKDGRVTKSDVIEFRSKVSHPNATLSPDPAVPISAQPNTNATTTIQNFQISPLRKSMFKAMTSTLSIPHFAYSETIDVTALLALRAVLNKSVPLHLKKLLSLEEALALDRNIESWGSRSRVAESERIKKISLLPLLVKALSKAMSSHPLFSCTLSSPTDNPVLSRRVSHDISIAVSAPAGGLFTPLLPSVDFSSPYQLASQIAAIQSSASAAASGAIPKFPDWSKGTGTITLSNVGIIGGKTTAPLIPPGGQLAIGAIGRIRVVPTYVNESKAKNVAMRTAEGETLDECELDDLIIVPRMMMDVRCLHLAGRPSSLVLTESNQNWIGYIFG